MFSSSFGQAVTASVVAYYIAKGLDVVLAFLMGN